MVIMRVTVVLRLVVAIQSRLSQTMRVTWLSEWSWSPEWSSMFTFMWRSFEWSASQFHVDEVHSSSKGRDDTIGLYVAKVSGESEGINSVLDLIGDVTEIVRIGLKEGMGLGEVHEGAGGPAGDDLLSNDAKTILVVRMQDVSEGVFERICEEVDGATCVMLVIVVCNRMLGSEVCSREVFPFVDVQEATDVVSLTRTWSLREWMAYLMCDATEKAKCLMWW